ncbi:O-methylsterigmatocystin oxidoreductase [Mycena sanguinolenta]|uniref:O-methylsterigmatocystin oxidoreductase n=1 Tax=Mycena sanguinolenta TaxID=230812 RepID=A0A8H6XM26_9AGAR|nr:O-methylsterigmatocystin oxidoreductase [Mycena sanguinolenta]
MALHPDCQAKAQKEIDLSVGDCACPRFATERIFRGSRPFCKKLYVGILRYPWVIDALEGVPHSSREDDMYRGMFIPKGSLIFVNIREMELDESIYSDPTSFQPERSLPQPASPTSATSRLVSVREAVPAVDENRNIIAPSITISDLLISHPSDFRCATAPRSPAAKALIHMSGFS